MGNITAILDVDGARCASCSYAIERLGRKVPGVEEVRVHPDSQEIHVTYGGDPAALGGDRPDRRPAGLRRPAARRQRGVVYSRRASPLYCPVERMRKTPERTLLRLLHHTGTGAP